MTTTGSTGQALPDLSTAPASDEVEPLINLQDRDLLAHIAAELRGNTPGSVEYQRGLLRLNLWRSFHSVPMNTFQSLLRLRVKKNLDGAGDVVTRLKRAPSIVAKLHRIPSLRLHQIQDIAGLRAVTATMNGVAELHRLYRNSRFTHELVGTDDYIARPKADGYRSIHLKYRYLNPRLGVYDGMRVEIQLRTKLQHAWATAVELIDMFSATSAIKAGGGDAATKEYFRVASAAFATLEKSPVGAEFEGRARHEIFEQLTQLEAQLQVIERLQGYTLAAREMQQMGLGTQGEHFVIALHLVTRQLMITTFPSDAFEHATAHYALLEQRAAQGEPIDPVLVNATSLQSLEKMFPNYFMDAHTFSQHVRSIVGLTRGKPLPAPKRKRKRRNTQPPVQ